MGPLEGNSVTINGVQQSFDLLKFVAKKLEKSEESKKEIQPLFIKQELSNSNLLKKSIFSITKEKIVSSTEDPFNLKWFSTYFELNLDVVKEANFGLHKCYEINFKKGHESEATKFYEQLKEKNISCFHWDFCKQVSINHYSKEKLLNIENSISNNL